MSTNSLDFMKLRKLCLQFIMNKIGVSKFKDEAYPFVDGLSLPRVEKKKEKEIFKFKIPKPDDEIKKERQRNYIREYMRNYRKKKLKVLNFPIKSKEIAQS